ncbi:hypothetical protein E2C01_025213 [Portunus trituberculatus]|uniref:Uncharacterized protein n=1 Tax=Portunus trituberculatus TaxID=210409 RepID=A0A5B7EFW8_PORTR|nr:hypothetical protein [Portunus trituberculatus]
MTVPPQEWQVIGSIDKLHLQNWHSQPLLQHAVLNTSVPARCRPKAPPAVGPEMLHHVERCWLTAVFRVPSILLTHNCEP